MRAAVLDRPTLPPLGLKPPRKSKVEGVFREPGSAHNDKIIYTEHVLDVAASKAAKRVKIDPVTGQEVWKKNTAGEPIYPILVRNEQFTTRRFVLLETPGRHVRKVYNFESTPEELEAVARQEREQDFFRGFVAEAVKAGLTPAQLIARIKADLAEPGEEPDQVESSITEEAVAKVMDEIEEEMTSMPDLEREDTAPVATAEKPKRRGRSK